jgi:hypothetical protein
MDIGELSMMLETLEVKTASEEEFQAAVVKVKSLSNVVPEQQIILYGLFKQCTVGDVSVPLPGEADVIAKHKWCVLFLCLLPDRVETPFLLFLCTYTCVRRSSHVTS